MSVLIDQNTKIIVQGITGKQGRFHAARMKEYNAQIIGGVSPGRGGTFVEGLPVYDTVMEVCAENKVDASMVLVRPEFVYDSVVEAIDNNIPLIVVITEHVPVLDTIKLVSLAKQKSSRIIGPNTIGIICPGKSKVGIMPGYIYSKGNVGIISRSGTLTHEVASNLTYRGIGQSTCIGIGGDPILGTTFAEALDLFKHDPETEAIVLIGEIGGGAEEEAAEYLEKGYPKPIISYIAGQTAPQEKKMGHAGAIVAKGIGSAEGKIKKLRSVGVKTVTVLDEVLDEVVKVLRNGGV
jgi:succinyl-CoA synthetase alpha subunit